MNILLTNDDGYDSIGIHILKDKLSKYGRVVIVAPLTPMSGKSASISLREGIKVYPKENDVFAILGTPVDCVCFGLIGLDIKFDLVVSGCNNGFNLSYDTMYSGTVGAALEALTHQVKSVAFSCEFNFNIVEKYFDQVFEYILDHDLLSDDYMLNVNFPLGDEVRGIKLSSLYYCHHNSYFYKENDTYYARRELQEVYEDKESDCYLVRNGFVSITPLNKSYFNKTLLDYLKSK